MVNYGYHFDSFEYDRVPIMCSCSLMDGLLLKQMVHFLCVLF